MSSATNDKKHMSVVICGHVDSGKSTTTGRLLYELGGIPERKLQELKKRADEIGKSSFYFAFFMDTTKDEQERGITIHCQTKEFFTENFHYTIIDAPGHRDFIKNMLSGASQADVGVLMVPADGGFGVAVQKGDHKANEIQGQTRQHARLLNLLGVKQLVVCVNKMDEKTAANYQEARYNEVRDEMKSMLKSVGWNKDFVEKNVPILPISGWVGDNLVKKSENMPWWNGMDVKSYDNAETVHVTTVLDALNNYARVPKRSETAPARAPISGVYNIKGVGDVLTSRIEQGSFKPGDDVIFVPSGCVGRIFSIEMHHKKIDVAVPGDNVGFCIKGLPKEENAKPKVGDVMVLKNDTSLKVAKRFTIQAQILDHPGELTVGYCPVACVRTDRSAVRLAAINWKMGKETGGQKVENPANVKANEVAELVLEPVQSLVVEPYDKCEGLGRVAIMEGNGVVMLGKVTKVE